jgi:NAD(P)-dependent dehydrogenase (short-subunit alcohol dehydrogenase family)
VRTERPIALVTGATSGVGFAVAQGLLAAGYAVAVCGRRGDLLKEKFGVTPPDCVLAKICDVRRADDVAQFFDATVAKFGRIDTVFNNAGRGATAAPVDETDLEIWHDVVDTNLNGAFYVARAAFSQMRKQNPQGGRIINNGSISAHAPRPHAVAYNATKHAISGLTKSLSVDGRPFNIAAGQIDIGNAATDLTRKMSEGVRQADGRILSEPTMDVWHVVDAVLYMAGLPLDTNVQTLTVMATDMPYIGRG